MEIPDMSKEGAQSSIFFLKKLGITLHDMMLTPKSHFVH
jgi:hypothetical protein